MFLIVSGINGFFAVEMLLGFPRITAAAWCFVPVSALEEDCFASHFSDILLVGPALPHSQTFQVHCLFKRKISR